jgi:hypothetical protein
MTGEGDVSGSEIVPTPGVAGAAEPEGEQVASVEHVQLLLEAAELAKATDLPMAVLYAGCARIEIECLKRAHAELWRELEIVEDGLVAVGREVRFLKGRRR